MIQFFRVQGKDLNKTMNKIFKGLEKQIPKIVAEGIGDASAITIRNEMQRLGTDNTGRLVHSFKPVLTNLSVKKFVIGQFNSPGSHLLEYGASSPFYSALGLPRIITFNEEPALRGWVKGNDNLTKAVREKFLKQEKVLIGYEKTRFGKRKWLNSYIQNTKPLLQSNIQIKFKDIKI